MSFFGGNGFGQAQQPQQGVAPLGQPQPNAFGQQAQPQQAGGFGQPAAGGFGQPQQQQQQQQAGGFGQPAQQPGGFGQPAAGGFGQPQQQQQQAGGFGQPAAGGGFGQPQQAAGSFGQPQQQQQQAGGFGAPAGGGFGQPAAGGFGQPAAGGFGAKPATGGFGQPQQPGAGGFGQPAQQQQPGGFGQPAAGGFGQPQQQQQQAGGFGAKPAGGFGQPAAGGFGQPQQQQQAGGFGQPAAGGFGAKPAAGGFGQPQQPGAGGFGQPAQQQQPGGFGQPAPGGFGAAKPMGGGFGQPQQQQQAGGFGQPAAGGGFGQPQQAAGGFGQPQQQQQQAGGFGAPAGGGFGQPAAGGFGQPQQQQQQAGGFGQPAAGGFGAKPAAGGFGQPAQQPGGFGQPATGGFGQPQQQQQQAGGFGAKPAGGFGQPAAGGFGQPQQQQQAGGFGQPAAGGFGAKPATGGFGQPAQQTGGFGQPAAGGFGQPQQQQAGGFGQPAAGGGFGQPQQAAGGFGQPQQQQQQAGGFGAPAGGGFGQPAAGGFGQPQQQQQQAGGFGGAPTSGFGQPAQPNAQQPMAAGGAAAAPAFVPPVYRPNDHSFLALPDYDAKPYGEIHLFATYDRPEKPKPAPPQTAATEGTQPTGGALTRSVRHSWLMRQQPPPDAHAPIKQQPAALTTSALSPAAVRDILQPSISLGQAAPRQTLASDADRVQDEDAAASRSDAPVAVANPAAPTCKADDYATSPTLEELAHMPTDRLHQVKNFHVRRSDGKCEVLFVDPVDLVEVELTEAVQLSPDGRVDLTPNGPLDVAAVVSVRGLVGVTVEDLRETCRTRERCRFLSFENSTWRYTLNQDYEPSANDTRDEQTSLYYDAADESIDRRPSIHHEDSEDGEVPRRYTDQEPPTASAALVPASTPMFAQKVGREPVLTPAPVKMAPFELPYDLPSMSKAAAPSKIDVRIPTGPVAQPEKPVYVVAKEESEIYSRHVAPATVRAAAQRGIHTTTSGPGLLSRSFRAAWQSPGMLLAIPTFAELHDGLEDKADVAEVRGAHVRFANPFAWARPSSKPLITSLVSVVRLCLELAELTAVTDPSGNAALGAAAAQEHYGEVSVPLTRRASSTTLSEEKMTNLLSCLREAIAGADPTHLSRVEARSLRQCRSVVSLLSALYALPEADQPNPNAVEEAAYLQQLRHRNLARWLTAELSDLLQSTTFESKAEELVQIMLCHKMRDAREAAKQLNSEDLARVVRVCGEGNQFGAYVEMARTGFQDGEAVRDRVVSLLSGKVEPFISQNEYENMDGDGAPKANPVAATWKQLLGIYTFYGCTPDTSANDIVLSFLDRLSAPSSRTTKPLPPYAERLGNGVLSTRRGKDAATRGNTFQDAALLILEGFAQGTTPAAVALHPHASSYCSTDFLTPFVILCVVRALGLARDAPYADAETRTLLGVSAQLEANEDTWFWGLVPLHMLEPDTARWHGVRDFCRRNALRASHLRERGSGDTMVTAFQHILAKLKVDEKELEPVAAPEEAPATQPVNRPSLRTHEDLQKALSRLTLSIS